MNLQDFIENFANALDDTDVNDLKPETKFKELEEWDSLTTLSIISMIKLKFNKTLSGLQIKKCDTIIDLYNLMNT